MSLQLQHFSLFMTETGYSPFSHGHCFTCNKCMKPENRKSFSRNFISYNNFLKPKHLNKLKVSISRLTFLLVKKFKYVSQKLKFHMTFFLFFRKSSNMHWGSQQISCEVGQICNGKKIWESPQTINYLHSNSIYVK